MTVHPLSIFSADCVSAPLLSGVLELIDCIRRDDDAFVSICSHASWSPGNTGLHTACASSLCRRVHLLGFRPYNLQLQHHCKWYTAH